MLPEPQASVGYQRLTVRASVASSPHPHPPTRIPEEALLTSTWRGLRGGSGFAGIRVALAWPFWPGGAAPRGVAIFVPGLPSAPCKPMHSRVFFFTTGKGFCHLASMPAPLYQLDSK